jgi:hypothetical protein
MRSLASCGEVEGYYKTAGHAADSKVAGDAANRESGCVGGTGSKQHRACGWPDAAGIAEQWPHLVDSTPRQ